METSYLPQFSYTYLNLLKYSTEQLKKTGKLLCGIPYIHPPLLLLSNSPILCVIKNFLNLSEAHIAKAENTCKNDQGK